MGGVFIKNLPPKSPQNNTGLINTPAGHTPVVGAVRIIESLDQHRKLQVLSGVKLDPEGVRQ